jgi:hypothetical protein
VAEERRRASVAEQRADEAAAAAKEAFVNLVGSQTAALTAGANALLEQYVNALIDNLAAVLFERYISPSAEQVTDDPRSAERFDANAARLATDAAATLARSSSAGASNANEGNVRATDEEMALVRQALKRSEESTIEPDHPVVGRDPFRTGLHPFEPPSRPAVRPDVSEPIPERPGL